MSSSSSAVSVVSRSELQLPLVVEIKGQDRLEVLSTSPFKMKVIACTELSSQLASMRALHGADVTKWPVLTERDHAALLINELILKLRGEWNHPYTQDEVCHCRTVSLEVVEQAILNGAHSPEMVSKWTSASTACGTCRPDVVRILKFRLGE